MILCFICVIFLVFFVFFFNDTATTEIYTLSLHDALPIRPRPASAPPPAARQEGPVATLGRDRKSTRLNSSHANISYAVFCLKKKKKKQQEQKANSKRKNKNNIT